MAKVSEALLNGNGRLDSLATSMKEFYQGAEQQRNQIQVIEHRIEGMGVGMGELRAEAEPVSYTHLTLPTILRV